MTANVALTDTFGGFKDKSNELIVMTQAAGMAIGNPIKLQDTTQSTSNTTGSIITAGGVGIAKNVTIGGSVNVHGNLHANGNITSDGSLTFGDADTDNVVFAADVNSHIIPNTDDTYDLGSTGQRWRNVWLNGNIDLNDSDNILFGIGNDMTLYHDGTNSYITNATGALKIATETSGIAVTIGHGTSEVTVADNLTVTGDLTVTGTTVQSVVMADKEIEIGAVTTPSDTTANLGGLRLKGATDKTITWTNSTDSWDFNQHIFPSADGTLDLGSSTKEWKDLYVDGIAYVDTINLNGTAITETAARINILATQGDAMAFSIALG